MAGVVTLKVNCENTGVNMERAIAAAERRAFLLPECRSSQLELALLYYFAGHYEDALEEITMLELQAEAAGATSLHLLPMFKQKLLLWKNLEMS